MMRASQNFHSLPAASDSAQWFCIKERLMAKFQVDDKTGCWNWTAALSHGYGVLRINGRNRGAHCLSYEIKYGPIPAGMIVCHHCDNPACINPKHLFLGTTLDNIADKVAKGRQSRLFGTNNAQSRLVDADIRAIRAIKGMSLRKIAKRYGVAHCTILNVRRGTTWAHVKEQTNAL